jgi:TetR/AcrR family transcriptional regulator, cholesterol catabolism regulator
VEDVLSRRERKKLGTRQALLDAASGLFREKGYAETTVEEITERADVAKGTFFNYFPSKEALLGELSLWGVEQMRVALEVDRGAPASPVARIKLLMRLMYEHAAQDIKLTHHAFAVRLCNPPPPPHQAKHQVLGMINELVAEAQICGEIRPDVDAERAGDLLRVFFFWQIRACSHDNGHLPLADCFADTLDLLMDGLAGPNWRHA